jgi:hypothetical protein
LKLGEVGVRCGVGTAALLEAFFGSGLAGAARSAGDRDGVADAFPFLAAMGDSLRFWCNAEASRTGPGTATTAAATRR